MASAGTRMLTTPSAPRHALRRVLFWCAISALLLGPPVLAQPAAPANLVEVSARITTSGQPSPAWLEGLQARGFDAVVYLAPPTVSDAVRDEPLIVARQGLVFVNLPIAFDHPTSADYETFAGIMRGLSARRVLVHCQINLRASSMVFLYRSIAGREDPQRAYEAVTSVWVPEGAWKSFIVGELKRNGIAFDPF